MGQHFISHIFTHFLVRCHVFFLPFSSWLPRFCPLTCLKPATTKFFALMIGRLPSPTSRPRGVTNHLLFRIRPLPSPPLPPWTLRLERLPVSLILLCLWVGNWPWGSSLLAVGDCYFHLPSAGNDLCLGCIGTTKFCTKPCIGLTLSCGIQVHLTKKFNALSGCMYIWESDSQALFPSVRGQRFK
jgi:hypothetical protein